MQYIVLSDDLEINFTTVNIYSKQNILVYNLFIIARKFLPTILPFMANREKFIIQSV